MSEKTDELLRALRNFDSARRALDEAIDHRGQQSCIAVLDRAEATFIEALEAVIDERINVSRVGKYETRRTG